MTELQKTSEVVAEEVRDRFFTLSFRILLTMVLVVLAILIVPAKSTIYERLFAMELLAVAGTLLISAFIYIGEYRRARSGAVQYDSTSRGRSFGVLHSVALALFNICLVAAFAMLLVSHLVSNGFAANAWYISYLVFLTLSAACFVWVDLSMSKVVQGHAELLEISITVFCADIPLMFGMAGTTVIALVRSWSGDGGPIPLVVGGAALFQLIITNVIFLAIKTRTYEVMVNRRDDRIRDIVWVCVRRMRGYVPCEARVESAR